VGEASIEAFLAVPGASAWRPARFGLKELSYVFDIGLPLALIGDDASVHTRRLRAGEAVRDGLYPERCVWDEIHVAAILRAWGAPVCFAAQTGSGPFLEVRLDSGETLDVELLRAGSAERASTRSRLVVVDVRSLPRDEQHTTARFESDGAAAADVAAVIAFEPRFWIGLRQKEWLYSVQLNPRATVEVPRTILGNADGSRRSMRFPLLT
ncbi:MAG TPA: hypothetical protein VIZ30_02710, partial [Pseudomonadales bacterium]